MQLEFSSTSDVIRQRLTGGIGVKWNSYAPDIVPMWIADMDFGIASNVEDHLIDMIQNDTLGYNNQNLADRLLEAFILRYQEFFSCQLDPAKTVLATDVVQAIYLSIATMTAKGDKIVIQNPIYPPFMAAVTDLGREIAFNTMKSNPTGYQIDFGDLEDKMSDPRTTMMLLCNPHNPTGRVFTTLELATIAQLAAKYGVTVISDEIHSEITYDANAHIPFANVASSYGCNFVITTSASKTFNLAGLRCAVAAFSDDEVLKRYNSIPYHMRGAVSSLGMAGTYFAWTYGNDWKSRVLSVLGDNRRLLKEKLEPINELVSFFEPEGTYLAWLDFTNLKLEQDLTEWLLKDAHLALIPGPAFGPNGDNFARLNFGTTTSNLEFALDGLVTAVRKTLA